MASYTEPNPPSRKDEDFPKTTTIPDGWVADAIMASYNRDIDTERGREINRVDEPAIPVPTTGKPGEETQSAGEETLFSHRLNPFPSASELTGQYL